MCVGCLEGGNEIIASSYSVSFINNIDSFSWGQKNNKEKSNQTHSRKIVPKQKKSKHQLDFFCRSYMAMVLVGW